MATELAQERLTGTWRFNPVHSSATFAVKYTVTSFRGRFGEVDAELVDGQLRGSVKVASVSVTEPNLVAHLKAPDFFDAERYPELTFVSRDIEIDGDRVVLDGDLTIKGTTKPIRATGTVSGPTEDFAGNTRLGFTLEATVDRTQFGIDWNADLPRGGKALANEVTLAAELEFIRA